MRRQHRYAQEGATRAPAVFYNGREWRHDFIVPGYIQAELSTCKSIWSGTAELPIFNIDSRRKGVAIQVSAANQQRPLQAVAGWL